MGKNKSENSCLCQSGEIMVLACSGASDVGCVSDLVSIKLRDSGKINSISYKN